MNAKLYIFQMWRWRLCNSMNQGINPILQYYFKRHLMTFVEKHNFWCVHVSLCIFKILSLISWPFFLHLRFKMKSWNLNFLLVTLLVIFFCWNLWSSESLSHKRPHNVSLIFHCLTFVSLLLFSFPTTISLLHSLSQRCLTFVRFSQVLLAWWLCFIVMFFSHILLHDNFNLFFWFESKESKSYFKRCAC